MIGQLWQITSSRAQSQANMSSKWNPPTPHHLTYAFDIFTRQTVFQEGGVVGGAWYLKRCLQPLPFSLPAIFRSIGNSLLAHFLRSSALTESLTQATISCIPSITAHCPPTLMISKFPTQTKTSPQSRNLLTLTSVMLITDLTTME